MSRGMTIQRDRLYAFDDWLEPLYLCAFIGLMYGRCDGLRTLECRRAIFVLSGALARFPATTPKVAFGLWRREPRHWKERLSFFFVRPRRDGGGA